MCQIIKKITINRQNLNLVDIILQLFDIYFIIILFAVFKKPTPPLKQRQLYARGAFVPAFCPFSICPPALGHHPCQFQMAYQVYPYQCGNRRERFPAFVNRLDDLQQQVCYQRAPNLRFYPVLRVRVEET